MVRLAEPPDLCASRHLCASQQKIVTEWAQKQASLESLMVELQITELHDVAVVVGTAFPVLAVAYYSAGRAMIDDKLREEGPEWSVDMPTPEWARNRPGRFLLQLGAFSRFPEGQPDVFRITERFRLATDRNFIITFACGFLLTLAYLTLGWRWALAVSVLLLQFTIGTLIFFATQVSMIHLASALEDSINKEAHAGPVGSSRRGQKSSLATRPMSGLITVTVMGYLLIGAALLIAIVIWWAPIG
jgi:hypothetical protein